MLSLNLIKALIDEEMQQFNAFFKSSVKSNASLLNIITNYLIKQKGKQIRPMFVFLSAKLFGSVTQSTYHAASFIELMHTATLIHDDVVDDAYERRSLLSINALWKNKIAVLIGDYLLAKGLLLAIDQGEFDLLRIISNAVKEMSEGELMQIEKARKLDIDEEVYFEIIRKKTATLIAACMASGAKSAGASDEVVQQMKLFGEYVGVAFQLKDDLLDYQLQSKIGKPTGNDIKEKKMTLPLIHVLSKCNKSDKRHIIRLVRVHNHESDKVSEVINFVIANGGIDYATAKMEWYKQQAIEVLVPFAESEAKRALIDLVDYTISRKV